jgi:hypothetical protein
MTCYLTELKDLQRQRVSQLQKSFSTLFGKTEFFNDSWKLLIMSVSKY